MNPRVEEELERARIKVESEDPGWAERSRRIERAVRSDLSPELFRGKWGIEFGEDSN